MWSYLTTRSSLNPLSGYVEDKAGDAQRPIPYNPGEFWGRPFPKAATMVIPVTQIHRILFATP
jgi:hypothetical protein